MSWVLEGRNRRISGLTENVQGLLVESEAARDRLRRELYRADMLHASHTPFRDRGAGLATALARWRPSAGEPELRGWEWYVLDSVLGPRDDALTFPHGAVKCVDWSAAADLVVVDGGGLQDALALGADGSLTLLRDDGHLIRAIDTHPTVQP